MEMTVKPISFAPRIAACIGATPFSMCRTAASSTTMASSTTSPTAMVSPSSVTLSMP